MLIKWKVEKAFNNELLRIITTLDDFLFYLQIQLNIVVNVSTNIYKAKFNIH